MPLRLFFFPWHSLMIFHEEASLITGLIAQVFTHTCPIFLLSAGRIGLFSVRQAVIQDLFRMRDKHVYKHISWLKGNIDDFFLYNVCRLKCLPSSVQNAVLFVEERSIQMLVKSFRSFSVMLVNQTTLVIPFVAWADCHNLFSDLTSITCRLMLYFVFRGLNVFPCFILIF